MNVLVLIIVAWAAAQDPLFHFHSSPPLPTPTQTIRRPTKAVSGFGRCALLLLLLLPASTLLTPTYWPPSSACRRSRLKSAAQYPGKVSTARSPTRLDQFHQQTPKTSIHLGSSLVSLHPSQKRFQWPRYTTISRRWRSGPVGEVQASRPLFAKVTLRCASLHATQQFTDTQPCRAQRFRCRHRNPFPPPHGTLRRRRRGCTAPFEPPRFAPTTRPIHPSTLAAGQNIVKPAIWSFRACCRVDITKPMASTIVGSKTTNMQPATGSQPRTRNRIRDLIQATCSAHRKATVLHLSLPRPHILDTHQPRRIRNMFSSSS